MKTATASPAAEALLDYVATVLTPEVAAYVNQPIGITWTVDKASDSMAAIKSSPIMSPTAREATVDFLHDMRRRNPELNVISTQIDECVTVLFATDLADAVPTYTVLMTMADGSDAIHSRHFIPASAREAMNAFRGRNPLRIVCTPALTADEASRTKTKARRMADAFTLVGFAHDGWTVCSDGNLRTARVDEAEALRIRGIATDRGLKAGTFGAPDSSVTLVRSAAYGMRGCTELPTPSIEELTD